MTWDSWVGTQSGLLTHDLGLMTRDSKNQALTLGLMSPTGSHDSGTHDLVTHDSGINDLGTHDLGINDLGLMIGGFMTRPWDS